MENPIFYLIGIVIAILQVILFFKIWQMTNDVATLTRHFCSPQNTSSSESVKSAKKAKEGYDPRLDALRPGDKVIRLYDGKVLTVDSVEDNTIFCKGGMLDGYKYYPKSSLGYIE